MDYNALLSHRWLDTEFLTLLLSNYKAMEFFKRFVCCLPTETKQTLKDYDRTVPSLNTFTHDKQQLTNHTESQSLPCSPAQSLSQPVTHLQKLQQHQSPQPLSITILPQSNPPECQFYLNFCQQQYEPKQTAYSLGFIKKPYETERAYLIRHIKHFPLSQTTLLYKTALCSVYNKLEKYRKRIFFYCMCVPGVNACSRSREFITQLKHIPLHFIYLTSQTNLRPFSKCSDILPIIGGPSSIRSIQTTKDWIILDYGQQGINDNYIRQNSPSYNKIVPTVAQAFSKSNNIIIIYPSGMTKSQIFDLHLLVFQELSDTTFNFDVELHSFHVNQQDSELLIGFYGQGIQLRTQDLEEAYPKCIVSLFDDLPSEKDNLYPIFQYLFNFYNYQYVLNLICQLREIDETPENVVRGIYSKLREMALDKGVRLVIQGEGGYSFDVFDEKRDKEGWNGNGKRIVQRKMSGEGDEQRVNGEEEQQWRKKGGIGGRKKSWMFSKEFQERQDSSSDELGKSEDSIFD